jgi:membrane-associated phospholipid phosphatase
VRLSGVCPVVTLVLQMAVAPAAALAQVEIGPAEVAPAEAPRSVLSGKTAALAGAVLAATLIADQNLRVQIQEYRGTTSNAVARVGNGFGEPRYVLPVLGAGLLVGQLAGERSVTRVALRAAGAVAIAGGITSAVKLVIGRSRPQGDGDADLFRPLSGWSSFPSGHTAVAFALATAIADETRDPWTDAALYGAASITALARLNDDRHWTSDVFVGALVGHLSARWLSRRRGGLSIRPRGAALSIDF